MAFLFLKLEKIEVYRSHYYHKRRLTPILSPKSVNKHDYSSKLIEQGPFCFEIKMDLKPTCHCVAP